MRFLKRFGVAALVSFLVSLLIASASYSFGLWLGRNSSNLWWMIHASIPFALLLGVAAIVQPSRKREQQGTVIVSALVGATLGFVYSFLVARHAPGLIAFFVLMLSCWVPSGISGMIVTASGQLPGALIGTAFLCVAAVVLPDPIFNALTHNQRLIVAFITPSGPSTARLEVHPAAVGFENEEEIRTVKNEVLQRVRSLGYLEAFRVLSVTREGTGRESLAIIVVQEPIRKRFALPVPDGSTVAYVEGANKWETRPEHAPVLRRAIVLRPSGAADDSLGYFEIPDAQGDSLVGRISVQNSTGSR
ncbi:MAG TPA: hypothetical protein VMF66_18445 [Candidatus Acidoferrum sp.]|nr:hypothetical protein [Candidatus Acidoferrum sp.]